MEAEVGVGWDGCGSVHPSVGVSTSYLFLIKGASRSF